MARGYRVKGDVIIINRVKMRPMTDMDYVELTARKLSKDNSLFADQKRFLESQMLSSSSLFKNMFRNKQEMREYLAKRGLITKHQ